jgi:predicted AAA+ superfamily ATPase
MFQRKLNIDLPSGRSAFLWGARKTGKSTFLRTRFPSSPYIDFLKTEIFLEYSKKPSLLREQLVSSAQNAGEYPVIIDEVQKIPQILDEIHWLIENRKMNFILCGSSARKLKRGAANLLGGRAWRYEMFPLTSAEVPDIQLLQVLNRGLIPEHYGDENYRKTLRAYTQDYLKEEVFDEGLTRNIPAFSRFFEAMAYRHGQLTNYTNVARECGVDTKTVKEYYQILVDTLLGTMIPPYSKGGGRRVISRAEKFYLFDVGVAGEMVGRNITAERGEEFGRAFEHFILMELLAWRSYHDVNVPVRFWRTSTGLEVDFVLGDGEVAIEVKGSAMVDRGEFRALRAFAGEFSPHRVIMVCNEREERRHGEVEVLPWRVFLRKLWDGEIY